jgi:uncharacterized protein YjeT (DUF2065 family)
VSSLLAALSLMLVIEGLLPLIAPAAWRETFQRLLALRDGQIRFIGAASMLGGAILYLFTA